MITQNPLIGSASKSLGNSTASKSFGKNIFRSKPQGQRKNSSAGQIKQNSFFESSQTLVDHFYNTLKIGWANKKIMLPLYSWLIGYFMRTAPDAFTPHETILPVNCKFSDGVMTIPSNLQVYSNFPIPFTISWDTPVSPGPGYHLLYLNVAWLERHGNYFHQKNNIAVNPLIPHFDCPKSDEMPGDVLYIWYFFVDSVTGEITNCNAATVVEFEGE